MNVLPCPTIRSVHVDSTVEEMPALGEALRLVADHPAVAHVPNRPQTAQLGLLDHLDNRACRETMEPQARQEKLEEPEALKLARSDTEVALNANPDQPDLLDKTVHPDRLDRAATRDKTGSPAKEATQDHQGLLVTQGPMEMTDLPELLDNQALRELAPVLFQVPKDQVDHQDHQVSLANRADKRHRELRDQPDHLDHLDSQVNQAAMVNPEDPEMLDNPDPTQPIALAHNVPNPLALVANPNREAMAEALHLNLLPRPQHLKPRPVPLPVAIVVVLVSWYAKLPQHVLLVNKSHR